MWSILVVREWGKEGFSKLFNIFFRFLYVYIRIGVFVYLYMYMYYIEYI